MLSPKDIAPKSSKAASIYSFDSGYGTCTVEDDEALCVRTCDALDVVTRATADTTQCYPHPSSTTEQVFTQFSSDSTGLGISNIWDVRVEDQLHLTRPESPVDPVTTKLNAFPSRVSFPPTLADNDTTCITCQLWDITNPGQGLRCDDCKSKDHIRPELLHRFDTKPDQKLPAPRLIIPPESNSKYGIGQRNATRCSACDIAHAMDLGGSSTCPTCIPDPHLLSPMSPAPSSTVKRSCARRPGKLPTHALDHLRAWLRANREDPYPTAETKRVLAQECGITEKQVTTWFTNTRARKLKSSDRTQSVSEDEGAYESDHSNIFSTPIHAASPTFGYETPLPLVSTEYDSTPLNLQTSRRGKKKDYRRVNTVSPIEKSSTPRTPATSSPNLNGPEQKIWQCTFCRKDLVAKSWRRHEETQHRPKYQWTCLATSPRLLSRAGTSSICAFCQAKNPSDDHFLTSHRISECAKKNENDRTFGRPDHLRQHIKNFHRTSLLEIVRDRWRRDGPGKNVNEGWTCGFCAQELTTWDIRETHIANHFKDGLNMDSWQDYPRTAPVMDTSMQLQPHTPMLTKLKNRLTGHSNHQHEHQSLSHNDIPVTFASLSPSPNFQDMQAAQTPPELSNIGFHNMEDPFMNEFDFSASCAANIDSMYPTIDHAYDVFGQHQAGQMDFDAVDHVIANPEMYGHFMDIDYQGDWAQGQGQQ